MEHSSPFSQRQSGVLCHPTSLPTGEFGPDAYHFVDFLAVSGFGVWQLLPLNPPDDQGSPYIGGSALALNTHFISSHLLREWGWLAEDASHNHALMLEMSHRHFQEHADKKDKQRLKGFTRKQAYWLDDYTLFECIKRDQQGKPWYEWPKSLRDKGERAIEHVRKKHADDIAQIIYEQFVVDRQWQALREYATSRGVRVFGDLPIFVSLDSADVWANRDNFQLFKNGQPKVVAGVPPDYFSETGQRWGNPLYNWEVMEKDGFKWWLARMRRQLELYDLVRIDHFRGFEACWEIKAREESAIKGKWVKSPGDALFKCFNKHFGDLPLVAEDLGVITEDVEKLRHRYHLPGMKILQFAFDGDVNNAYLPHCHENDSVVYSGTHDNETTLGWYLGIDENTRADVNDYFACGEDDMPWPVIRATLSSVANMAVIPMQDLLALDNSARMNVPGVSKGNWAWKFHWGQVPDSLSAYLLRLNTLYGRVKNVS